MMCEADGSLANDLIRVYNYEQSRRPRLSSENEDRLDAFFEKAFSYRLCLSLMSTRGPRLMMIDDKNPAGLPQSRHL
ncbi:hypothetical protein DF286_12110 [Sphingosinicella humi]|uniref:Uncharacterized protein n=1 Tax=Allosphingosinicella humi TaxID=2068657 RepID=A0A2U2J5B2_9SPHN|nr:hypothetical protein DF286_12110 [Sphingosinicella humi]